MKKIVTLLFILLGNLLYGQMPNKISTGEKIYGLSKFWQEVNYNFVYLNKVDKAEWNILYKELIVEVQKTENDYEYYRLLQKFSAFLKDGHTNVFFPKEIQKNILSNDFGDYKFFISNMEGKAIITRINSSKKKELPIGTEITKVNEIETRQYLKENVFPYISSSTNHILEDWGIKWMLQGYVGTTYNLDLKLPNGKIKSINLTLKKTEETEMYPPEKERELLDFKWVNKEIAYISLNSFGDWKIMDMLSKILPELYKAKKLIVDLRYNGGGNSSIGAEIIKYFTNDSILYGSKQQSRLHIPTYKAWGKWTKVQDTVNNALNKQKYLSYRDEYYFDLPYHPYPVPKNKTIQVPTVLLIGHNTASAAEDFLIYADNQKHMIKIGEPTFGSTGQPLLFDMPNGGGARVCTKKDTYPNGKEFVGYGVQPDITVKKTLEDYLKNKDPALKKAIEYLKKKK
ncbi:MAG: S41 family peptidase [Flavobacteriaceae bacterium]|nr:S41 family peptidase [Flavobacteriaceae bacterium]